ncbi:hypothetical protein D9611_014709 [Ephemerocybe angulata]|uniref:Uncharacterized protein n=1 Tax=Ephemerocybe angulata TaxID=980116 RepID=A0A8H5ARP0_9AGAR|nr:hypothetical protein D9611_014709 [Tulosesus angulatus]
MMRSSSMGEAEVELELFPRSFSSFCPTSAAPYIPLFTQSQSSFTQSSSPSSFPHRALGRSPHHEAQRPRQPVVPPSSVRTGDVLPIESNVLKPHSDQWHATSRPGSETKGGAVKLVVEIERRRGRRLRSHRSGSEAKIVAIENDQYH